MAKTPGKYTLTAKLPVDSRAVENLEYLIQNRGITKTELIKKLLEYAPVCIDVICPIFEAVPRRDGLGNEIR